MKLINLTTIILFIAIHSNSQDHNSVRTIVPMIPIAESSQLESLSWDEKSEVIQIASETGKVLQIAELGSLPTANYVIKQFGYDEFNRITKEYLPIANESGLSYLADFNDLCSQFYSGTNGIPQNESPYSEYKYNSYPSNNLLESSSDGLDWAMGNGHTNLYNKRINTESDQILNLFYDNGLKIRQQLLPSNSGQESIYGYFNTESDLSPNLTVGNNFQNAEFLTYQGGGTFLNESDKIIFSGTLSSSEFYKIRIKVKAGTDANAILATLWGISSTNSETLHKSDGSTFTIQASELTTDWMYIESQLFTGFEEIYLKIAGPTGSPSDIIDIDQIEIISFNEVITNLFCSAALFLVEEITDPDGYKTENFIDGFGHIILSKIWSLTGESQSTQYVYDNFGNLRMTLSPKAIDHIVSNGINSLEEINDLSFYNNYDGKNRLIETKVPGKEIEYFIYTNSNNLALYQDGLLREQGKWKYFKYDELNRQIETGIYTSSESRTSLQSSNFPFGEFQPLFELRSASGLKQYTNNIFPSVATETLSLVYYDEYPELPSVLQAESDVNPKTLGLAVSSLNYTINDVNTVTSPLWNVIYFDNYYRTIEQVDQGLNAMTCRKNFSYSWSGDLLEENRYFANTPLGEIHEKYIYNYFRPGILRGCDYSINDQPLVILFRNQLDEMGRLSKLNLFRDNSQASNYLQEIDYSYNEKGWLKRINNSSLLIDEYNDNDDDVFGQELYYHDANPGSTSFYQPRYNGNISAVKWKSKASNIDGSILPEKLYSFEYDEFQRLKHSYYAENTLTNAYSFSNNVGNYDELTDYDQNGNILSLSRFNAGELIDQLTYNYENLSNKLIGISEESSATENSNFKQYAPTNSDNYDYDVNGNLSVDENKGISFEYNHMNLIGRAKRIDDNGEAVLTQGNSDSDSKVHFSYSASGQKLKKRTPTTEKYYFGNLEFSSADDVTIYIPNGRVRQRSEQNDNHEFVFDFFITDYLGNVRAIITNENAQIEEVILTMEVNRADEEETDFYNVDPSRTTRPLIMPADDTYGLNLKSSELKIENENGKGPGRMIPIKQGDVVDLSTKYWFSDLTLEENTLKINQIIEGLASSILSSGSNVVHDIEALSNFYSSTNSPGYLTLSNIVTDLFDEFDLSKPQAFMIYVSMDEKFNVSKAPYTGIIQVTEANALGTLIKDQIKIPINGYFHVFLVNVSSKPVNFDNMTVNVIKANVLQQLDYYPFGLMWESQDATATSNLRWHHSKEMQEDEFLEQGKSFDLEDFGARMYDPVVARWWSVDPLADNRNWMSPYNFVQNNPITRVDPSGTLDNPIYDYQGEFLGTDDKGLQGEAIIMHKENFKQGMKHEEAISTGTLRSNLPLVYKSDFYNKIDNHVKTLSGRPDYDGYLTKDEADKWWLEKSGKPLFVDQSKIQLPGITTKSFDNKQGTAIYYNFIWGYSMTGKVYGTLKLTLVDASTGAVRIGGSSYLDEYDFRTDGRWARDLATWWGRPGGEFDGKDFFIFGYGTAHIQVK